MNRGAFISFEGCDGSGKTTQAKRLVERLENAGRKAVLVREPGTTELGALMRQAIFNTPHHPTSKLFLFAASMMDASQLVVAPALAQGLTVVADRWIDSSHAYQGAMGHYADYEINLVTSRVRLPDLTILLDGDPEVLNARAVPGTEVDGRAEFRAKVRKIYRQRLFMQSGRMVWVDAERSEDEVAQLIWSVVSSGLCKTDA